MALSTSMRKIPLWTALVVVLIVEPIVLLKFQQRAAERPGKTVDVSVVDSGSETVLRVGDRLAVHYTSLGSAGLFWEVEDTDVSVLLRTEQPPPEHVDDRPGAPEPSVHLYVARRPGKAEIILTCRDVKRAGEPITDEMHFPVRVE